MDEWTQIERSGCESANRTERSSGTGAQHRRTKDVLLVAANEQAGQTHAPGEKVDASLARAGSHRAI